MKPVKWGIISTANIGMEKVIPGMLKSKDIEIVAIASRKLKSAQAAASKLGIPKAYGSYEAMLADPEIEAVYNPAAQSSPCATDAGRRQGRQACAVRKADRHHRQGSPEAQQSAKRHPCRGSLHGAPQSAMASACQGAREEGRYRRCPRDPGLLHLLQPRSQQHPQHGGYRRRRLSISAAIRSPLSRFVFDAEPKRVIATFDRDPKFKTDRTASGIADFGDGRHLTFTVSTQTAPYQRAQIGGTKGRIEVEIPFNAPPDKPNRYFVQGMEMNEGQWHELPVSRPISDAGRSLRPRHPERRKRSYRGVEDAIQNMKIIDAFFRSEKSGKWEKP